MREGLPFALVRRAARAIPWPRSTRRGSATCGNVEALVKEGVSGENRSQVVAAIRKHAEVVESLREKVA